MTRGVTGLTTGGFYPRFESKRALFTAAIRESPAKGHDRLFLDLRNLGGIKWLRAVVRRSLNRPHRGDPTSNFPLLVLVGKVAREGVLPRKVDEA